MFFFLHSVGTFIIPTDDEVIFFRGVGITTNQLWLVIYNLPRKKRRDEGKEPEIS